MSCAAEPGPVLAGDEVDEHHILYAELAATAALGVDDGF